MAKRLMQTVLSLTFAVSAAVLASVVHAAPVIDETGFTQEQVLGKQLFFDASLSATGTQSCASCHSPGRAFTDPRPGPTSAGANPALFGNRNAPSASYAQFSPAFHFDTDAQDHIGGQFWDGRAATLEEQAKAPFVGAREMGNPDQASVIDKLANSASAGLFKSIYGPDVFTNTDLAYDKLAQAIASFERTKVFAPFSSKYDAYLAGKATLTAQESHGLELFEDPAKGNCAACHPSRPSPDNTPPLFTDFSYDNIGVPKNPNNKFYTLPPEFNPDGANFIDVGLQGTTGLDSDAGRFKVPTLRNVAITGPLSHNGFFDDLQQIVDFYNTRDVKQQCTAPGLTAAEAEFLDCWPQAELPDTVNHDELGNLGLSPTEVLDIVSFLGTLTDGFADLSIAEPASIAMLGLALGAMAVARRRSPSGRWALRAR